MDARPNLNTGESIAEIQEWNCLLNNSMNNFSFACLFVLFGFTSLSTIFQSCHDGSWMRELNAHLQNAPSLKYHAPETWHGIPSNHIILTPDWPILALVIGLDKSEHQVNSFLISRRKHMLLVLIISVLVWSNSIYWFMRQSAYRTHLLSIYNVVTLKIRSMSPESNHVFPLSWWCICVSLVKFQPLIKEIMCTQTFTALTSLNFWVFIM